LEDIDIDGWVILTLILKKYIGGWGQDSYFPGYEPVTNKLTIKVHNL
jgi:hypothetical protein